MRRLVEPTSLSTLPLNTARAVRDMTRCIACHQRFLSDEPRNNIYIENTLTPMGAIHDECYDALADGGLAWTHSILHSKP